MSIEQYIDDTTYLQWEDGMYVMLDELEDDYERALVEGSLRRSVFNRHKSDFYVTSREDCLGVIDKDAGLWWGEDCRTKLTRAQALYIATGETTCTTS
jgi:hypothetical protein